MSEKWSLWVLKHRNFIIATWLFILILGVFSSTKLNSHLTTSLNVPNSSSQSANEILIKDFHENVEGTFTVIYPFKNATPLQIAGFESKIAKAAGIVPTEQIAQEKALGGTLFVNVDTALSLSEASSFTKPFREAIKSVNLQGALITGPPAIKSDVTPVLSNDLRRGEIIGISLALLLLLIALGFTFQIFAPLLLAAASMAATVSLILLIAQRFLVVLYTPNIVELIGLGLSIDYSLLILFRYRRELEISPAERGSAIVRTMQSAGKTVLLSGSTVAIGLATLIFIPVPFIRSLGVTSLIVPLIAIFTSFTLLPILLLLIPEGQSRTTNVIEPFAKLARFIVGRPRAIAFSALVLLGILSASVFGLHVTPSSLTAIPSNLESQQAISFVTSKVGSGVVTPNQLIIDLSAAGQAQSNAVIAARKSLVAHLSKNPEAMIVAGGSKAPYVDLSGRYLRIFIFARHSFGEPQAQKLVSELHQLTLSKFGFPESTRYYIAGAASQGADLLRVLRGDFPWMVLFALLATFLLLVRALRSIVLPLKAILLDLISLSATYGIVVFLFGNQHISNALGLYHLNQIEAWALVFLFVLLFGVSMDYEVFILSSIKEAKEVGASNDEAIIEGVSQTGIVVTSAALIFIAAVSGLALGHFAGLQEIGIGLGFGVLVDATIVRGLLLPSVMVLLGRWNWWLPSLREAARN